MGVISTFDPKYKWELYNDCVNEYWVDNVVLIKKSWLFLTFYVILPTLWYLIILALLILLVVLLSNRIVDSKIASIVMIVWIVIAVIAMWSIWCFTTLKYYLDYCMDFSIVTPQSFIRYDQTWFFKRTSKVIDLVHIRSVSVQRTWIINSLFNNWNIIVLSEWSDFLWWKDSKENAWKIYFRYVYNPEYYSQRIEWFLRELNTRDMDWRVD